MKCFINFFTFLSFIIGWVLCESNEYINTQCLDLNPQNSINMEIILGTWYGNEIITHNDDDQRGVFYYNTCLRIHISNVTGQMLNFESGGGGGGSSGNWRDYSTYARPDDYSHNNYNYLRLVWEENDTTLNYTVRYEDNRRGFWISSGPQNGELIHHFQYEEFKGTIQVMKVVQSHLVLTFCNKTPGSKLFSTILTRKPEPLTTEDVESIRKLLGRRGLSTFHIRKLCTAGASSAQTYLSLFLITFTLIGKQFL